MVKASKSAPAHRPSADLLRELIDYDSDTGALIWKLRGAHLFRDGVLSARGAASIWNAQHAGKPALSSRSVDGYCKGNIQGRAASAHIVAFAIHHGRYPDGPIGHLNGNGTDNRLANLSEGNTSRSGTAAGVCKQNGKWAARISANGRRHHLGTFARRGEALAARRAGEARFGFSGRRAVQPGAAA